MTDVDTAFSRRISASLGTTNGAQVEQPRNNDTDKLPGDSPIGNGIIAKPANGPVRDDALDDDDDESQLNGTYYAVPAETALAMVQTDDETIADHDDNNYLISPPSHAEAGSHP